MTAPANRIVGVFVAVISFALSIYPIEMGQEIWTSFLFFSTFFVFFLIRTKFGKELDIVTLSFTLFFLYICFKIFFGFFDGGQWKTCTLFAVYELSQHQIRVIWYSLWSAFLGSVIGAVCIESFISRRRLESEKGLELDKVYRILSRNKKIIILVGALVAYSALIYFSVRIGSVFLSEGYTAVFKAFSEEKTVWFYRFLILGQCLSFLLLATSQKYGLTFKYIGLLIVGLCGLMAGQKIWIVSTIMYIMWFELVLKKRRANRLLVSLAALFALFLAGVFNEARAGRSGGGILTAVYGTSNSYCTLPYLDEVSEKKWYFFSPVLDRIARLNKIGNSSESDWQDLLNESSNLSYHLTNAINPIAFKNGNGTGTTFIAEAYSLGGFFMVFFIYTIWSIILIGMHTAIRRNLTRLLFIPPLLIHFIDIHRDSFFDFLIILPYLAISYALVRFKLGVRTNHG